MTMLAVLLLGNTRYFSRKIGKFVSQSTVKSIKKAYTEQLKKRPCGSEEPVDHLPPKKRGRKVLIGSEVDENVQAYVRQVQEAGGSVSSKIVIAGAKGILLPYNCLFLSDYGGPVALNRSWACSLLTRMKLVQRKGTTAKSKHSIQHFDRLKHDFLEELKTIVRMEEVPTELIMNWDQTGMK